MLQTDRYSHWLRQDIPRLAVTVLAVVVMVGGLWALNQRVHVFERLLQTITSPTPKPEQPAVLQPPPDTAEALPASADSDPAAPAE